MSRKCFVLMLVLFILGSAMAFQAPLSNYGFEDISTSVVSEKICKTVDVNISELALSEEGVGLLSINSSFGGKEIDNTYISVSVNGQEEKVFWKEFFSCKNDSCWARVYVPELKKGSTQIKLCAILGGNTTNVSIFKESFIGIYDIPFLKIKNQSPSQIFLGDRAKMSIIVSNEGTELATVYVQFVHPDTRAKVSISSFDIVEGDSSATTSLLPGETRQFDYYIKPTILSSYNLPSAALFFTNNFGEEQVLISNHPTLSVVTPKRIELSLVTISETNPVSFKAVIKNNWSVPFNGTIILSPQTKVIKSIQDISVSANGEQEMVFEVASLKSGKEAFFATITDMNDIFSSNTIEIESKENSLSLSVMLALGGIILGLLIFVWIYFAKK
jgi:hypothetical protein